MVVCVLLQRFALLAALGGSGGEEGAGSGLLARPVALAPEAGRHQVVGDASPAAEAFGVTQGMPVGEALARCPELRLVPPDPEGVRSLWSATLDRLELIGAGVESDRPGEAFFEAGGLRRLHGGNLEGVLLAARRALAGRLDGGEAPSSGVWAGRGGGGEAPSSGVRSQARSASLPRKELPAHPPSAPVPAARLGVGPSRFVAYAAALRARPRRRGGGRLPAAGAVTVPAGAVRTFLAPLPVGLLRSRPELAELPELLEQLGVRTLGELAALPAPAVAERFGHPGLFALDLAQGRDRPLEPRRPAEPVVERLTLPEAASGPQLERALELLVGRVLARGERRGRALRALVLSARFVESGTWRERVTLRQASADPARLRTALAPRLAQLPAPAEALALEVEAFGPPAHDQVTLTGDCDPAAERRARLGEAVGQVRQAAGSDAALRVLEVDPDSRVPERRSVLAPWEESG